MAKASIRLWVLVLVGNCCWQICFGFPAIAQDTTREQNIIEERNSNDLDIPSEVIQNSPVLQEWLEKVPNVLEEIKHDPAFFTRLRIGFTTFSSADSSDDATGLYLGIEDIFISRTGLTISADYQTAFNGDRNAVGADLHYFVFPLGNYINFAPLLGYRYVQSNDFFTDGIHAGLRLMLSFSRTNAGDISLAQSFMSPGNGGKEVGITSVSVGYAVTSNLRLSGDIERQNSSEDETNRFGVNLELLF